MSELIDHLAELTGYRDRDILDVTLVSALRDLLHPDAVAIYRVIGDGGRQRWTTRAHLQGNDTVATADAVWADLDSLPPLETFPARMKAMAGQASSTRDPSGATTSSFFAVATDREVVGVLEIKTAHALEDGDTRMVDSVLRIYRNFQALLDYSERDTLTGLLNRKTFDESFLKATRAPIPTRPDAASLAADASRMPRHWLGVIDIDHFKRVNDNHGHLIGDEVLLLLSRLMHGSFRFHDRLYRFGGEEFVVLMRCDSDEEARMALERMRANTAAYAFPQVGTVTVSIGYTEVRPSDSPSSAFERADRAVYHAKGHGRNQVQSHANLLARGELADESRTGGVELF